MNSSNPIPISRRALLRYGGAAVALSLLEWPLRGSALPTDWPQFRGPDRSGVSKDIGLPLEWSATSNVAWRTELPGAGTSSPIVFGGRVFVTCYSGYGHNLKAPGNLADLKRHLVCLDARSGKVLWSRTEIDPDGTESTFNGSIAMHGYASHTPAADASGVYAYFGAAGAVCYSHDGERKWGVRLGSKGKLHGDGSAASPLLYENLFIVNAAVETAEAFEQGETVALDKRTGQVVWREKVGAECSSPLLVPVAGAVELVVGTDHPGPWLGLDPLTGKRLWECKGKNGPPTPVAHDGVIYTFHEEGKAAIRAGGRGDVTTTHTLWESRGGTRITSPVYHDGHLYWASLDHNAKCLDARTGQLVYNEPLGGRGGDCYASPVLVEGRIYYVSRATGTYVVAAKPKYERLAHNLIETDDSIFNASPAICGGKLFLRSDKYLYCIGKRA